jgi:hypothetical protein
MVRSLGPKVEPGTRLRRCHPPYHHIAASNHSSPKTKNVWLLEVRISIQPPHPLFGSMDLMLTPRGLQSPPLHPRGPLPQITMRLHQQNPTALENYLTALEALQVGFKSIWRSHCMQLDRTWDLLGSRDFFFFKLGLYSWLFLIILFSTFLFFFALDVLFKIDHERPSDTQVVSSSFKDLSSQTQVVISGIKTVFDCCTGTVTG